MNHIERFYATVERKPVDRPASWLGIPDPKSYEGLFKHFGAKDFIELKKAINDDIFAVEMPYHSPTSDAIYAAFDFAKEEHNDEEERTLTSPGFFENYSDPAKIDDFDWPDPEKYIDPEKCKKVVDEVPEGYAVMGVVWSAHFQDACAAFGMETALMKMLIEPQMFRAVIDRITEFYLKANEIFFENTKGKLHAVLIGNDLGSQTGLMLSPQLIREFVLPGTRKLIAQAKSYGLKVIHHSCGAIYDIIPDLIEAGTDVIHPIQALATGMEADRLKRDFGDKVTFCGGVDAQNLLVNGSAEEVSKEVERLKGIFPTGLILSPSHEAILPDIPPENIEALFSSV
jgi:uroporphyrinogen decarboxylase